MKTQGHSVTRTPAIDLYCEVRGEGPAVVLIPGATGDAGHFTKSADILRDEFTVITYDRRGNSRSTQGAGNDDVATVRAQADDAAALITACGLDRAVVFGTSGGAIITLELITRHPKVVRGAVVHEPPLISLLPPQDGPDPLEDVFKLAAADPRAALEVFIKLNSSPTALEGLDAATRDRMLNNAEQLFTKEAASFLTYQPDADALRHSMVPLTLLRSANGLPYAPVTNGWLESNLGIEEKIISGHHAPYFDTAKTFAEELRPYLRALI